MALHVTDEMQAEGDKLHHLLSSCLQTSEDVTEVQNAFKQLRITYDILFQLTEDELMETFKEIGIKIWHRRVIINKFKEIPNSGSNARPSQPASSVVVILTAKQNDFIIQLHNNTENAKKNAVKLQQLQAEINANAEKLKSDIKRHYRERSAILAQRESVALQKVKTITDRKVSVIKQEHVAVNEAIQFLHDGDAQMKQIMYDTKLDIAQKQIAITQHIEASQQTLMKHKGYIQEHMSFITEATIKYESKDKASFEQFVNTMDDVLDADINLSRIQFIVDKMIIVWKSDLNTTQSDVAFDLQFRERIRTRNNVHDDEKDEKYEWKVLQSLKPKQIKVYLNEDDGMEEEEKNDGVDGADDDEDESEWDDNDDEKDGGNEGNDGNESDGGTAGLLSGLTIYEFRIAVTLSSNVIYSKVLVVKTPRFKRLLESSIINTDEKLKLMEWIPNAKRCKFNLLFRASRDGSSATVFHQKCDGKGPNISIIRSSYNHVFGGYTENTWSGIDSGHYRSDKNAFLYLLRSAKGDKQKVYKASNKPQYAVYCQSDYGISYGDGHDLHIGNNATGNTSSYSSLGSAYASASNGDELAGASSFKVTDYEIWQILSPQFSKMDSSIVNDKEFSILHEWVKASGKNQYRLLFRASVDGYSASTFHTKCNNHGPTLIIVQSAMNHVFGGYTEQSWKSAGGYVKDDNAWICLLRSSKNDKPEKWDTKQSGNAIYDHSSYGPIFGGGHDFLLADGCNTNTSSSSNFGNSYGDQTDNNKLAGSNKFMVTDYEVWQLFS